MTDIPALFRRLTHGVYLVGVADGVPGRGRLDRARHFGTTSCRDHDKPAGVPPAFREEEPWT